MGKICKTCWEINEYQMQKYCKECYYREVKPKQNRKYYELKRTPVNKIWKRTKERIKKDWTETQMFEKIYNKRKHCELCWTYVMYPAPWCFAHILAKGMYPHLRYFENNIAFVCWEKCHRDMDSIIAWNNKIEIEAKIVSWKTINFKDYA